MLDLRPPIGIPFSSFGVPAVVTPRGSDPVSTTAVEFRRPADLSLVGDLAINELRGHVVKMVGLLVSDMPTLPAGSTIVLGTLELETDADEAAITIADEVITVVDYTLADGTTVTVVLSGKRIELVEGTHWLADVSNDATAESLAAAIHAIEGIGAVAVSGEITVSQDVWEVFSVLDQDDEQLKVLVKR